MEFPRQKRKPALIDMSPLIDCVFQLLIFFMLSSSFMAPIIQLKLPQASTHDKAHPEEVLVSIDEQGKMFVNTKPIDPNQLRGELTPLIAQSKTKVVTFRGDEKMHYRQFIEVLDEARHAGAVNLNIAHRFSPR